MSVNPAIRKIEDDSHEKQERITAILGEHLPEELRATVQLDIDGMINNAYGISDEMQRKAYGILLAMLGEHLDEIQAAWSVAFFEGCVADFAKYEATLPITVMPESKLMRLFDNHPEAFRDIYG